MTAEARGGALRLFREATQLITVSAMARVAGIEVLRIEIQVHAVEATRGGRPTVTVKTDTLQIPQSPVAASVAEARGGAARHSKTGVSVLIVFFCLFREATQLKTAGTMVCAARIAGLCGEAQVRTICLLSNSPSPRDS